MKNFKSFMSEGTVKFDQHDGEDEDFIKLTKSLGLKVKTKGDETIVSGNDGKINKMLKTMNMKKDEDGYAILEGSKEEYQKFFDKKLKKYGVKSPAELSDEEKKKFFDEIDKEWTGEKDEEIVKEYIKKDGVRRRCAGGDGRKTKKVKTEEEDCEDDEEMDEGKMSEIDAMLQDGMTAEQIAKKLKLDLKALKQLLKNYK